MDIGFITEYISPVTLVVCLAVGFIIKYCFGNETLNRFIPCIVAILGIAICAWLEASITPQIVAAGLISGLASTGLYEALKQLFGLKDTPDTSATVIPEMTKKDEDDPAAVSKNKSTKDTTQTDE